jgi:hypothetical protein
MISGGKAYYRYWGRTRLVVLKSAVGLLFLLALSWRGSAQTCCSGGVPLGGSLGLGSADSKSLQVLATYDYNAIHDLVSFSEELEDDTRSRTTQSSIIELNYGLNQRFSVATVIPFIRQTRTIQAFSGEDFTSAQGLGDMVFLIKYRILPFEKSPNFDWIVGAGPKFPTGRTDYRNNQGLTMAADMQPGSGSFDGIFWSYFLKSRFMKNPNLGLLGVTTFRYSGENKNYNTTQTYRFGNEFQAGLGITYSLFLKWPVDVSTLIRYRSQSEDLIDGGVFPSSGGQWVYFIPGLNINFSPVWSFRLSGDVPLYRKLDGTQLTTSYKLTAAVLFNIPFNRKSLFNN